MRRTRKLALVLLIACTPQQGQAVIKTVDDAIQCIATNVSKTPEPPPALIAATCGVSLTPDFISLISTLETARSNPNCTVVTTGGDAGAKGPGI
ncbi:MAG: hypothetical protein ACYDH4_10655 [Candidatus Cryosericum sp.]